VIAYAIAEGGHAGVMMSRLLDTHNPLIGLEPRKNVTPGLVPVWCTIASHRSSLSLSASSFPSGLLITCLLWSMKRMILSPAVRHSIISFTKCLQNRTRGQVRSFFFCDEIMSLLLICCFRIHDFVLARVVHRDYPCAMPICTTE
jgi:hypothetical protein